MNPAIPGMWVEIKVHKGTEDYFKLWIRANNGYL